MTLKVTVERCNLWPHVASRHISISQLLSLWRHSHYDVIRAPYLWRSRTALMALAAPVLIMTSLSLWRHSLLSWPCPALRTNEHMHVWMDTLAYRDCCSLFPYISGNVPSMNWIVSTHETESKHNLQCQLSHWHHSNSVFTAILFQSLFSCPTNLVIDFVYYWHHCSIVMVALWNRADHYIFMLLFVLSSSFFSSPNLSRRRLDVCNTSTHGVALVRI